MTTNVHSILSKYFGYTRFRPGQMEIISSILSQKNTLAILPTGGGKSLCFQIPALAMDGTTIVVSPLIALMKDQVDALKNKNIKTTFLNSSLTPQELNSRLKKIKTGHYKLVYLAPERLLTASFLNTCQNLTIPLLAIDEAHCTSLWGHDFRPSYTHIVQFVQKLQNKPTVAAFTATATKPVILDVLKMLNIQDAAVFKKSFKRSNLFLSTYMCKDKDHKLLLLFSILKKHTSESGIIYVSTRDAAEEVTEMIHSLDFSQSLEIAFYHGGMDTKQRTTVQEQFLNNSLDCIVSTNAFGMGVDKSNIRFVVHYHHSAHIENYYQEAGRAGRDGLPSFCYLLYQEKDQVIHNGLLKKTYPDTQNTRYKQELLKLKKMISFCTTDICKNWYILRYFDEDAPIKCTSCSSCIHKKAQILPSSVKVRKLSKTVKKIAKKHKTPPAQILSQKLCYYIILLNPKTKNEFLKLPGIGHGWVEKWYDTIPCLSYSGEHHEKKPNDHRSACC